MHAMALSSPAVAATDEALAREARDGDRQAYAELVARHRATAFAYAYARLGRREEAEDVAQEAFVRAWAALDRYRPGACWGAWFMRILRNLCVDASRRRAQRQAAALSDDWACQAPSPEVLAMKEEERARLAAAVAALPERLRMPLLMHYGSRQTCREIARALGIPESTVTGRLAGALRHLRRALREETP